MVPGTLRHSNRYICIEFILVHLLGFGPLWGDCIWKPVQYGEGVNSMSKRVHILDEGTKDVTQCMEITTIIIELFAINEGEEGLGSVPFDDEVSVHGCLYGEEKEFISELFYLNP